jgi:hypothetical protein
MLLMLKGLSGKEDYQAPQPDASLEEFKLPVGNKNPNSVLDMLE